ncbi:MAG: MarR family winged helix-turn-helix transcriptional regulator [Sphingobium sp.]
MNTGLDAATAIISESSGESRENLPGWIFPGLDYATFRLTLLSKAMDRLSIRAFADRDITYAEWRVLCRLASIPAGATVKQIADLAWVDRAEVSRAVAALEKRGLTARRENPGDGRTRILHITQAGMDFYRPMLEFRCLFHETLMMDLSEDERRQLDHVLGKIAQRLDKVRKEGFPGAPGSKMID